MVRLLVLLRPCDGPREEEQEGSAGASQAGRGVLHGPGGDHGPGGRDGGRLRERRTGSGLEPGGGPGPRLEPAKEELNRLAYLKNRFSTFKTVHHQLKLVSNQFKRVCTACN